MVYAKDTSVPIERSKAEIEKLLIRYGATDYASGWTHDSAMIGFGKSGRTVRFILPLPPKTDKRYTKDKNGYTIYSTSKVEAFWAQDHRSRWRALCLVIKAKLEAVESGITTFEQEFLAHIVIPGGGTVGDAIAPRLEEMYATGRGMPLLPERT